LSGAALKVAEDNGMLTGNVWVPLSALSITVSVPVVAFNGLAVSESASTAIVQIDCAARMVPQLLVCDPMLTLMLPIATDVVPLLETITFCGTPARVKVNEDGDSVTGPPESDSPVPVNGIESVELTDPFSINKVALRGPVAEGVNETANAHLAPAARLDGQ
jgi:hypothetical protein